MEPLEKSLRLLKTELAYVGGLHKHAIFGSTALKLRGIIDRTPDDIDIFVSRRVWGALLANERWYVETPNAGDPPILTYDLGLEVPLHVFFDWNDDAVWIDVQQVLREAEMVAGFRLATVEEVLKHKRAALSWGTERVQKHRPDIEAIERYLESRGEVNT